MILFQNIILFFEPWVVRKYMCVNKYWQTNILEVLEYLDKYYMENMKRFQTCNHRGYLKYPYDYNLIIDHNCIETQCSSVCYRNNEFGLVHWDITTSGYKPLKCIKCGNIYVNKNTAKKIFFLRDSDLNTNNTTIFKKVEIQWLCLMKFETVTPTFRRTKARLYREQLIQSFRDDMKVAPPFSIDSILNSYPFRVYLEGSWKVQTIILYNRFCMYYPQFLQFYQEWKTKDPTTLFFRDMTDLTPISHGYIDKLMQSLSWYLGISIYNDNLNQGLILARSQIINVYQKNNHPVIGLCNDYFISNHQEVENAISNFKNGMITFEELLLLIKDYKEQDCRHRGISTFLHSKGIYHEMISCSSLSKYIKYNSVNKFIVLQCMKNHITGIKSCYVV